MIVFPFGCNVYFNFSSTVLHFFSLPCVYLLFPTSLYVHIIVTFYVTQTSYSPFFDIFTFYSLPLSQNFPPPKNMHWTNIPSKRGKREYFLIYIFFFICFWWTRSIFVLLLLCCPSETMK